MYLIKDFSQKKGRRELESVYGVIVIHGVQRSFEVFKAQVPAGTRNQQVVSWNLAR